MCSDSGNVFNFRQRCGSWGSKRPWKAKGASWKLPAWRVVSSGESLVVTFFAAGWPSGGWLWSDRLAEHRHRWPVVVLWRLRLVLGGWAQETMKHEDVSKIAIFQLHVQPCGVRSFGLAGRFPDSQQGLQRDEQGQGQARVWMWKLCPFPVESSMMWMCDSIICVLECVLWPVLYPFLVHASFTSRGRVKTQRPEGESQWTLCSPH